MSGENKRTSDQLDNDINSGADLASRAIPKSNNAISGARGKIPSRPSGSPQGSPSQGSSAAQSAENNKGGNDNHSPKDNKESGESGADNRDNNQERPSNRNQVGNKKPGDSTRSSSPSSINPQSTQPSAYTAPNSSPSETQSRIPNSHKPQGADPSGGSQAKNPAAGKTGDNDTLHDTSSQKMGGAAGGKTPSGGSGQVPGAGSGTGAGSTAGTAGGSATGAGAGSAAGSAAGAGGGAAAGATAGSVAGPAGTVAGAVAGAVIPELIKLIIKIAVFVLFIICVFCMHPSTLYDFPQAVIERDALESTYNAYYESIEDEYRKDIQNAKSKARSSTSTYNSLMKDDSTTACDGRITLSAEDLAEVQGLLDDNSIDRVKYDSPVTLFSIEDNILLESMRGNINLVISLLDVKKDNWFIQLAKWVLNSLTGGWLSKFTDGVSRWWDGLWNDFVIHQLALVEAEVWIEEITDDDSDRVIEVVGHIKYTFTYDLRDLGVGFYSDKLSLAMDDVNKAAEMSHYLGDLFGNINEYYSGWYVQPGDWTSPVSGGSTGQRIVSEIEKLENEPVFNDVSQVFPLQGYANPKPSSWFGPRDFALDPFHTGIDFSAPSGTLILAIQDGIVLYTDHQYGGFGRHIVIYHGNNVATMYAHMRSFGQYKTGDTVKAGDVIGYVGSTGLSTGPHLHFQLNIGSQAHNPIGYFSVFNYLN